LISEITSAQISEWFGQIKYKLRKIKIKEKNYFIFTEAQLINLIDNAPKFKQPILKNINKNIAEQLIDLEEKHDWDSLHIAKIASENWPQLNIHTPNAIIGSMIVNKSRSVLNNF
jgi:hypothetical protein